MAGSDAVQGLDRQRAQPAGDLAGADREDAAGPGHLRGGGRGDRDGRADPYPDIGTECGERTGPQHLSQLAGGHTVVAQRTPHDLGRGEREDLLGGDVAGVAEGRPAARLVAVDEDDPAALVRDAERAGESDDARADDQDRVRP